ncbi:MAG: hypothetical protein WC603_04120 [Candidatus Paceibacterota bacterium]|jgi:hypothetical protein
METLKNNKREENDFEKYASDEARKYNSFIENLLSKGVINKEDIMRVDAELENSLRDKINEINEKKAKGESCNDNVLYYQKQLEYLKDAGRIYDSTQIRPSGGFNSITHELRMEKVNTVVVDDVKKEPR